MPQNEFPEQYNQNSPMFSTLAEPQEHDIIQNEQN